MDQRAKHHIGRVQRELLAELSLGDVMYGFLLSARSTSRMQRLARERAAERQRRKYALEQLKRRGYVSSRNGTYSITEKGTRAIGAAISTTRAKLKEKKWDHKWRVVAYDIPQAHAHMRFRIRGILKKAGFVLLQQSIWVFPHHCEELVQLIKEESHLAPHILYGVLERVEGEERLRKTFKL